MYYSPRDSIPSFIHPFGFIHAFPGLSPYYLFPKCENTIAIVTLLSGGPYDYKTLPTSPPRFLIHKQQLLQPRAYSQYRSLRSQRLLIPHNFSPIRKQYHHHHHQTQINAFPPTYRRCLRARFDQRPWHGWSYQGSHELISAFLRRSGFDMSAELGDAEDSIMAQPSRSNAL
jgi:hypothetical protein